jgi:hypothetical protein
LNSIRFEAHFQQKGFDFVHEIFPHSSGQHRWIFTNIDYFTKWVKSIPTREATPKVLIKFLEENNQSKFQFPSKFIIDNALGFISLE